ncbi:MAG: hypothetical protein IPM11_01075 [Micropruina sp.]|jgi:hypothetical protein|nr:hypothetical protein [Micropruina sp.]
MARAARITPDLTPDEIPADPAELVRAEHKITGHRYTVIRAAAEATDDLRILDLPATDITGAPLPPKHRHQPGDTIPVSEPGPAIDPAPDVLAVTETTDGEPPTADNA